MSPNRLMLERETATPLEITYDMPPSIKAIPTNQYVWELQEAMEDTHRFVKTHTEMTIRRQKKFHVIPYRMKHMSSEIMSMFPVKKPGCSLKFTWFWKGPFAVKRKLCDVLYKVDCGRAGSLQIIHATRMSKVKSQILRGEETLVSANDILDDEDVEEEQVPMGTQTEEQPDEEGEARFTTRGRKIRKPKKYKDFVFSLFRCGNPQMVNSKTRPRKQKAIAESKLICPVCKSEISQGQTFKEHVIGCARDKVDKLSQC